MTRTLLLAVTSIIGFSGVTRAAVMTYSDPALFNTATTGRTAYSFSVPYGSPSNTTNKGTTFTQGPLKFADSEIDLNYDGDFGQDVVYVGAYDSPSTRTNLTVIISGGLTAVGFQIGTYNPVEMVLVSVNGYAATTIPGTTGHPSRLFLGITDTSPITSLVFTDLTTPGDEIDILSFTTGSLAVSEPASLSGLSLGFLSLIAVRIHARWKTSRNS